jgi:uncharacterized protein YndB with AHSA1/START domain
MFAFEEDVVIRRPQNKVFEFIADGEKANQWNSAVKHVEKLSDGPIELGTRFRMLRELPWGKVENEYEIIEYVPSSKITIKTTSGPTPFVYKYALSPIEGGTRLALEGEGDTSDVTHVPGFLMKVAVKRGVRANLEKLKEILEGPSGP